MDEIARARLEGEVKAACQAQDWTGATTALLRGYGPEVYGFLAAIHRDETEAGDAFALLAEAVWKSLPRFAWDASARTWTYAVARNVSRTMRRDAARLGRRAPRADSAALSQVAEKVRTQTSAFLRTEKRSRLQELRDELPEEDRMLLVLRVDRGLAWNELARVLRESEGEEPLAEGEVTREAARLRKRFQLVKDRLREMAKAEGLLE